MSVTWNGAVCCAVCCAARRLRENGLTYQADIEVLWDIVQPLLLDADMEVGLRVCVGWT